MVFCQSCGTEILAGSSFCPKCGKPASAPENVVPPQVSRPVGITILAILQLIAGIFSLIAAIGMGAISTMGGMQGMTGMTGMYGTHGMPSFGPMAVAFGGFLAVFFAILAVFAFVISGALFSGKRWGRTLVIIISIIDLIIGGVSVGGGDAGGIVGMILNLVILYYMWRPHVIAYFHR